MLEWHPNTQALANALAENTASGLRGQGEEVAAANPYGCNQYGEGWAMPHNGQSRVPRGSVPSGSGGGVSTGGNSGKGQETKERDQSKINFDENVHKTLVSTVGEDAAKAFYETMEKAPEDIRAFYERHKGGVKRFEKTRGTSCCSGGNLIMINPNSMKNQSFAKEGNVLFHEMAHALDYSLGREQNSQWGLASAVELHAAIEKDYNALIEAKRAEMIADAKALLDKHGGKVTDGLLDELVRKEEMNNYERRRYKEEDDIHFLPDAILLAQGIKQLPILGRVTLRKEKVGLKVAEDIIKESSLVQGVVCDAFESKTGCKGKMKMGHKQAYYRNWGRTADGIETFANLYAGYAQNDKKTMEKVEKILPETTKAFKNILKKGIQS